MLDPPQKLETKIGNKRVGGARGFDKVLNGYTAYTHTDIWSY